MPAGRTWRRSSRYSPPLRAPARLRVEAPPSAVPAAGGGRGRAAGVRARGGGAGRRTVAVAGDAQALPRTAVSAAAATARRSRRRRCTPPLLQVSRALRRGPRRPIGTYCPVVARFVLALAALLFLAGCSSDAPENSAES